MLKKKEWQFISPPKEVGVFLPNLDKKFITLMFF